MRLVNFNEGGPSGEVWNRGGRAGTMELEGERRCSLSDRAVRQGQAVKTKAGSR